jgi:hypothetical protein
LERPAKSRALYARSTAFGVLENVATLDLLADVEHFRAFTDVLAADLNRSDRVILSTVATILAREQRQQADDLSEVLRLGRVRQIAASELHRILSER